MKFPTLKKKANSFLLGEDGKISKKSIITTATILIGASSLVPMNAKLVSAEANLGLPDFRIPETDFFSKGHSSHSSHSSHCQHSQHGAHSSHGSNSGPCPCGY